MSRYRFSITAVIMILIFASCGVAYDKKAVYDIGFTNGLLQLSIDNTVINDFDKDGKDREALVALIDHLHRIGQTPQKLVQRWNSTSKKNDKWEIIDIKGKTIAVVSIDLAYER